MLKTKYLSIPYYLSLRGLFVLPLALVCLTLSGCGIESIPDTAPGVFGFIARCLWYVYRFFPSTGSWDWLLLFILLVYWGQIQTLPYLWRTTRTDILALTEGRTRVCTIHEFLTFAWHVGWLVFLQLFFASPEGRTFLANRYPALVTETGSGLFWGILLTSWTLAASLSAWRRKIEQEMPWENLHQSYLFDRPTLKSLHLGGGIFVPDTHMIQEQWGRLGLGVANSSVFWIEALLIALLHTIFWYWSRTAELLFLIFLLSSALQELMRMSFVLIHYKQTRASLSATKTPTNPANPAVRSVTLVWQYICLAAVIPVCIPRWIIAYVVKEYKKETKIIIFDEQFIDNRNNWAEGNTSEYALSVANSHYRFEHKRKQEEGWLSWMPAASFDWRSDFDLITNIKHIAGVLNYGFGVCWGFLNTDNYHSFQISANGYYRYDTFESGVSREIVGWTKTIHINEGDATNMLTVRRREQRIELLINNSVVHKDTYPPPLGEQLAFCVYDNQTIEIDYVEIHKRKSLK